MLSLREAVLYTFAMAAVIFACRALPFVLRPRNRRFLAFVERTAPPVAMTVLTFNALAAPIAEAARAAKAQAAEPAVGILAATLPTLAAAALTAGLHLWKRNALLSIFCGVAAYMALSR